MTPRPLLVIVPAHNEAACLPAVVSELRAVLPTADLLVVDDGSSDETPALLTAHGVASVRLPQRMGLGTAVRAGLVHGMIHAYPVVVRIDGDGQHDARDIPAIVEPVLSGAADVVIGTRFLPPPAGPDTPRRLVQRALSRLLSATTGRSVTDATSGFCAFGPSAVRLLTTRHPNGYPEVELRLLLHREGLRVEEVPIRERPRLAGRTTLTPMRLAVAAARVAYAIALTSRRGAISGEQP